MNNRYLFLEPYNSDACVRTVEAGYEFYNSYIIRFR